MGTLFIYGKYQVFADITEKSRFRNPLKLFVIVVMVTLIIINKVVVIVVVTIEKKSYSLR